MDLPIFDSYGDYNSLKTMRFYFGGKRQERLSEKEFQGLWDKEVAPIMKRFKLSCT
jgi:hypothetical protein